jgi:Ala-tRNA(Pro) deacylase
MSVEDLNPTGPDDEERAAETRLTAFLKDAGVGVRRFSHPPLHRVEDSRAFRESLPELKQGAHTKNLFLKDKKGALWLAVCLEDRRIRIPDLSKALGAGRFSFGSAELLQETLGVRPGAVSPFALINDIEAQNVRLALDAQMMQAEVLNFHPLHNHATVAISNEDMMKFFAACGHGPTMVDFDALEALAAARDT